MNARTPPWLTVWVLWCTACVAAGWLCSALGQLRGPVWLFILLPVGVVLVARTFRAGAGVDARWLTAWHRRVRRPLPLVFALLALLALLGGLLHAPNNYDALTYRLPRVLHWLAEGQWHWITTPNLRMNLSAANAEWISAPWLAWFRSDRPLFLLSWISYLFLPGLIFSVFRLAGVPPRVAWPWMWLLPSGYGYVLQAGSIGNELPGAVFALAAVHYALVAAKTRRPTALWLAMLSAALLSGTKVTNLPLLLPCAVALWPALPALRGRVPATAAVALLALGVSFAPTAGLNHRLTGHWSGDTTDAFQVKAGNPAVALTGNVMQVVFRNFEPPVVPGARRFDAALHRFPTDGVAGWIRRGFPRYTVRAGELPQEESAALGLGVSCLLLGSVLGAWRQPTRRRGVARVPGLWIGVGAWAAAGLFLAQVAVEATPRLLLPYYVFFPLPFLIMGSQHTLVRQWWWRCAAVLAAASALIGLVLTPARPLWPALTVIPQAKSGAASRARAVYSTYAQRNDALAPLRRHLPGPVTVIGFLGDEDDMEYALWRPFGSRRVVHLSDGRRIDTEAPPPMEWVVVKQAVWERLAGLSWEQWLARHGGEFVARETIVSKVSAGPETWWVARFRRAEQAKS